MAKIERLPSGNYRTRVSIGKDVSGKYRYKSFTASDKKTLKQMVAEYILDTHDNQARLVDAIEAFIDSREGIYSPTTIDHYRYRLSVIRDLCPDYPLDMDKDTYQTLVNTLILNGRSPNLYTKLISAVLFDNDLTPPKIKKPKVPKITSVLPTEDDLRILLDATKDTELEIPIKLGMLGLRRGEVCAVTADSLDGDLLTIDKSAYQIRESGQMYTKAPKTAASVRVIAIPHDLAEQIRKKGRATTYVPLKLTMMFGKVRDACGLPYFRFHDLRHFFASYCHNILKLSDAQIKALGGWESSHVMHVHYISAMDAQQTGEMVAEKMGSVWHNSWHNN